MTVLVDYIGFIITVADCRRSYISMQGNTALMFSSVNGLLPVAETLIQAKADVNAHNVSSLTIPLLVIHTSALAEQKRLCLSCSQGSASPCLSVRA